MFKDATKVGAKLFQSGATDAKAIAQHIPKSMFSLNPAQLAKSVAAGAGAIAATPGKAGHKLFDSATKRGGQWVDGALHQGANLWKGAQDWGHKAQKFTEAIPGWIDHHVDQLTKGRANLVHAAAKQLEHIPVVGKAAQAFAWFDNKVGEFGGGVLKGAGSMVGGVANMVTHPVETGKGLFAMAEHVPVMGGLVPNPLKLLHAGTDIIFNGADPKTRLQTVMDPAKSLEDDKKFGKALVEGFIEPYKKSWSEGKYFEVAGRAAFDVGSLFIGAGEANAAIKTAEVASVASKAGKASEVANVARKTGEAAEVANATSKTTEVANVADKTEKATEVASTTGKIQKAAGGANAESTRIPRNGKREVLDQLKAPEHPTMACGPTSCGMVLDTARKPVDLSALIKETETNSIVGSYTNKLADTLKAQGVEGARWSPEVSFKELQNSIKSGDPAIALIKNSQGGGHFVVIDGITKRLGKDVVAIRDPWKGEQYFLPVQEFSEKYTGQAVLTDQLKLPYNRTNPRNRNQLKPRMRE
jgi:Peptidase_C39 like family